MPAVGYHTVHIATLSQSGLKDRHVRLGHRRWRLGPILPLTALILAIALPARAEFMTYLEDLPLMPGLKERSDDSVVFHSQPARLADVATEGAVTIEQVRRFYLASLPQLGWSIEPDDTFYREQEALTLEFKSTSPLTVWFRIRPRER